MSGITEKKVKLKYDGSIGWLIFWVIIFFPVALVLLATSGRFNLDGRYYHLKYDGSRNWLCFWIIVLFPVAIMLMLLNGIALIGENSPSEDSALANKESLASNVPIV